MTTSRSLRLAVATPWLLLTAVLALGSAPAFRQLLLNPATDQPATAVNLSGSNWTGTLDAARLPASVPLVDGNGSLTLAGALYCANGGVLNMIEGGNVITTGCEGGIDLSFGGRIDTSNFGGGVLTDHSGGNIDTSNNGGPINTSYAGGGVYTFSGGGDVNTSYDGGPINTTNGGGLINTSDHGGPIDTGNFGGAVVTSNGGSIITQEGGGSIQTNGYGSPADQGVSGPIGSLYCDQDPDAGSGHVLWVREASGWVGK